MSGADQPGARRRLMTLSAAAIYAGAVFVAAIEAAIPGGQAFSVGPGLACVALSVAALVLGPRIPRTAFAAFGIVGVALIGVALAGTNEYGDGAVLYMWPVVWMAYFFGTRGTVVIVAWVGIVHAAALLAMSAGHANSDRWLDVQIAVLVVAVVVRTLAANNERLVARLRDEAQVDQLTRLLNRRGFEERSGLELARARRARVALAVVMFDLDHFKRVNDLHGHDVGDQVLSWFGQVLGDEARPADAVARLGGEEFVVLLSGADCEGAMALADRVRARVAASLAPAGISITVSAGVAEALAPADLTELLEDADRALYAAKRTGRNRVVASGATVAA